MVNKRFLDLARRQRNEEAPSEKIVEKSRIKPSSTQGKFHARFLDGDFGEESFEKYQELVARKYGDNEVLNKFKFEDDVLKGSNSYSVVVMNEVLREQGYRVATSADIDKIVREEILDLRGKYEEMALVFFNEEEPNEYLARSIGRQSEDKGFNDDTGNPLMIPLAGLELVVDENSPEGLDFKITDKTQIFYAPQFSEDNDGKKFSKCDNEGLPVFDENGDHTLYTTDSGLRVLFHYWDLYLGARYVNLANSNSDGRVLAVRGEATTQKTGGKK